MGRGAAPLLAAAAAAGLAAGCARQGVPPGGEEDRRPPAVIAVEPDTQRLPAGLEVVRFRFDERISEQVAGGLLDEAAEVSPATGEVHVDHGRRSVDVRVDGGFRPGLVYRVTLLPVFTDLFGNTMTEPFEVVFSTGGEIVPTAVAGLVADRITGEPVPGAAVRFRESTGADSLVHVARSGRDGIYAVRSLPPGTYVMTAFEDRDRDSELDDSEPRGERLVRLGGPTDTLVANLRVLEPDTTPARLVPLARAEDSVTVRLEFDDWLDPLDDLAEVEVRVELAPDSVPGAAASRPAPGVAEVLHAADWEARRDSLRGDTAAAARRRPGGARLAPPGQAMDEVGGPLPSQLLYVVLDGPLEVGVAYRVVVEGVENVNDLRGGGGEATVVREAPEEVAPAPDSLRVDTLRVDTLAVRPRRPLQAGGP